MATPKEKIKPTLKAKLLVAIVVLVVFVLVGWIMSNFWDTENAYIGAAGGAIGLYVVYLWQNR